MLENPLLASTELLEVVGVCPVNALAIASWCAKHCEHDVEKIAEACLLVSGMLTGAGKYLHRATGETVPVPDSAMRHGKPTMVIRVTAAALNRDVDTVRHLIREQATSTDLTAMQDLLIGLTCGPLHSFLHDAHDLKSAGKS